MENFYQGLFCSTPYLIAASMVYGAILPLEDVDWLDPSEAEAIETEWTVTSDRVSSVIVSLMNPLWNADGEMFAGHQRELRELRQKDDENRRDVRLLELIELHYLYPRRMRSALLAP
jgi:hypothetical protein